MVTPFGPRAPFNEPASEPEGESMDGLISNLFLRGFDHSAAPEMGCLDRASKRGPSTHKDLMQDALGQTLMSLFVPLVELNRSPVLVVDAGAIEVLAHLHQPGDKGLVFDAYRPGGQALWRRGVNLDWIRTARREGVWFLAQPVDDQTRWNPRLQRYSRRSEESVTAWRYAVLESNCQGRNPSLREGRYPWDKAISGQTSADAPF
jgi:hypothetical protein